MLATNAARAFYSRFSSGGPDFCRQNIPLAARCALAVYRREGRAEARAFIALIRAIIAADILGV